MKQSSGVAGTGRGGVSGGSGGGSKISISKAVKLVREGAKIGEIPDFHIPLSNTKAINKILETVDKNFDMPSFEWLKEQRVDGVNSGWKYNPESSLFQREYRITTKDSRVIAHYVAMPQGSTREARSGAEKKCAI